MTPVGSRVRARRSEPVIAVTGARGALGAALLARLADGAADGPPIGIDTGRTPMPAPSWRIADVRDPLVEALLLAATGAVTGHVGVGSEGSLSRTEVERISGLRPVVVPRGAAIATASRLHRVGALATPPGDLRFLVEPWVVGSRRLRAAGWLPRWTNEAALRDHLARLGDRAGRGLLGLDGRDARRAAAGATIAVAGSLAMARARSGRRR